jgi:hypothetical protein
MLRAVVKIVGQSLGETISEALAAERNAWERKLRELRLECAKLSATLDSLHDIIGAERAKTLDCRRCRDGPISTESAGRPVWPGQTNSNSS